MFLRNMDMTEGLRLGGLLFGERGARPVVEGIEKNLKCRLRGVAALAFLSLSFEVKDSGAGNMSSRPPCCAEFRYRNDGSSSSSRTGDEALCIRACKSRIMLEWAKHSTTSPRIFSSRTALLDDESALRARVG